MIFQVFRLKILDVQPKIVGEMDFQDSCFQVLQTGKPPVVMMTTQDFSSYVYCMLTNVLKPVVSLFVLSLSFVVIYQKILVEFLVQSLVQ